MPWMCHSHGGTLLMPRALITGSRPRPGQSRGPLGLLRKAHCCVSAPALGMEGHHQQGAGMGSDGKSQACASLPSSLVRGVARQPETGAGGSVYATEIGKPDRSGFVLVFVFGESWLSSTC